MIRKGLLMNKPLLLDIVSFLIAKQIVIADGTDAFRDFTPEAPDSLVALHEYSGNPASLYDPTVHRSVQVLVRDLDADEARQKAVNIFKAFQEEQDDDGRVDLTPTRWGQVYLRQPPFLMRRDENNRAYYAFNIGITTTIE